MEVRIDAARCQGHARCWAVCPEVFEVDDLTGQAFLRVLTVAPALTSAVRAAVAECPENAITTSEESADDA